MEEKELLEKIYYNQIVLFRKLEDVKDKLDRRTRMRGYSSVLYDLESEVKKLRRELGE